MPPISLPYTYTVKGRYWRFRRAGINSALPGQPGDPAFHAKYAELMRLAQPKAEMDRESWSWFIARYRRSEEFKALRPRTQDDYSETLTLLDKELGPQPFRLTTRAMIKAVRDSHAKTPRKAHKVKQTASRLYSWADEEDLVPADFNPARSLKRLKHRAKAITPWSEEEIALFLANCPAWLKTPVMLALYTGQRREDVVQMEWADFHGAVIRVRQSKTGEPLDIACHPELRKHLAAVRTKFGGKIARTAAGRPFTANGFSQALRRAIEATEGMPRERSPHGLRYAAAGRLDDAGCTVAEAVAVLGHRTYQMALRYMAQRRASEAALAKQEKRG